MAAKTRATSVKPKAVKARSILSPADQERLDVMTGGSANSLSEALTQWENERSALAEFQDENQALRILHRRTQVIFPLMEKLIIRVELDSGLFLTDQMRKDIESFRTQFKEVKSFLKQSKIILDEKPALK